jgi:hypothetical protein
MAPIAGLTWSPAGGEPAGERQVQAGTSLAAAQLPLPRRNPPTTSTKASSCSIIG